MRLEKLKIKNFRCFGEEEQVVEMHFHSIRLRGFLDEISALLGMQNILREHSYGERSLTESDFYLPKDVCPADIIDPQDFYFEMFFTFPEINEDDTGEIFTISPYPIASEVSFHRYFVVEEEGDQPYLRIRLEASMINGSIDSKVSYITCSENQKIKEEDMHKVYRQDMGYIIEIYIRDSVTFIRGLH